MTPRAATPEALDDHRSYHELLVELTRSDVEYALLLHRVDDAGRPTVLVAEEHLPLLDRVALAHGLEPAMRVGRCRWLYADAEAPHDRGLVVATDLQYGRGGYLGTGEPALRVVRRAHTVAGVRVASPADELVDAVLHCLIDLGDFPDGHRAHVSDLMARMRRDARLSGRAAERVQQELSPALEWHRLLADVVHGRWDALLARARHVRWHLWRRAPLTTAWRRLRGLAGVVTRHRGDTPPGGSSAPRGEAATGSQGSAALSRRQIRGSSLLLTGRGFSMGLKFLAELLVVRYLTTAEYGAWTYALSFVVFLQAFSRLGLHRAVSRFVPMHIERGERRELFSVLALVLAGLLVASSGVLAAFYTFPEWIAGLVGAEPDQPLDLLVIMVLVVPVETLDDFLTGICAAFDKSRTIFVRRYVLSPGFRVSIALLLVLLEADVRLLAYGYLLSAIIGVAYYACSVVRVMRREGLFADGLVRLSLPFSRVLSYTGPVMAADLCSVLMTTTGPLLLGYFAGVSAVALFQVVIPLVTFNRLAGQSFGVLFEPAVSRLTARDDWAGLDRLYWRTAVWVAVLSFPAFAVSFTASEPLTVLLFGERYRAAAPILSFLALGTFVDALLGFNGATLRVSGRLHWLVGVNALSAVVNVALNLALIPRFGAVGAGIATGTAWVLFAGFKQIALHAATGIRMFDTAYVLPYTAMLVASGCLVVARLTSPDDVLVLAPVVALAVLTVLGLARTSLSVSTTFPELARVRVLKVLLG